MPVAGAIASAARGRLPLRGAAHIGIIAGRDRTGSPAKAGGHQLADIPCTTVGASHPLAGLPHADEFFEDGLALRAPKFVNWHSFFSVADTLTVAFINDHFANPDTPP